MAKAKNKKPETPIDSEPKAERVGIIALKGRVEYRDWLEEFAKSRRSSVAALVDQLLAKAAKDDGFRPPPER